MGKVQKSFRFEETDVLQWQTWANIRGLTLSEWIRRRCNISEFSVTQLESDHKTIDNLIEARKVSKAASSTRGKDTQVQQAAPEAPSNSPVDMRKFLP